MIPEHYVPTVPISTRKEIELLMYFRAVQSLVFEAVVVLWLSRVVDKQARSSVFRNSCNLKLCAQSAVGPRVITTAQALSMREKACAQQWDVGWMM